MAHSAPIYLARSNPGATDCLKRAWQGLPIAVPVSIFVAAGQWQRVAAALAGFCTRPALC